MESGFISKVPINWERINDKLHRLKIGEIYHLSDSSMSMICLNCTQEFQYSTEFLLHIQEHYVRGEIAPLNGVSGVFPNPEVQADDAELKVSVVENYNNNDDNVEMQDHSELNCEVIENDDFDQFDLDGGGGGWSDDDSNDNKHTVIECEPKMSSEADNKQEEEEQKQEGEQQQQQLQFIDGTDYEKCHDKFKCLTCDHESAEWEQIKEHMMTHMRPTHVKCPICLMVFASAAYVRTHCSQIHNIRVSANKIKEVQSSSNPVDISTLEQPEEVKIVYSEGVDYEKVDQKFQCITCHRVMAKFDHMKEHLLTHNSEKNVYCPYCSRAFVTESYVRKHVNRKHKKKITADEIRAAQPKSGSALAIEMASKAAATAAAEQRNQIEEEVKLFVEGEDYEKSNGRFKCLTCGREMLDHIRDHLLTHSNAKNVHCPLCDKTFIAIAYVRKHVNRTHKKKITAEEIKLAQTTIDASNKNTNSNDDKRKLRQITKMATVTTVAQKNFECFDCHRPFIGLSTLRTHMKLHSGIKYPCPQCGKTFSKQSYVRDHVDAMHGAERVEKSAKVDASFKCKKCQMSFDTKQMLRQHSKTHTSGPFLCVICGAVYKFSANLRCHMEIHQDNRHKCLDASCQKTFPMRRYMLNHYRSIHLQNGKRSKSKTDKQMSHSLNYDDDDEDNEIFGEEIL